MLEGLHRLRKQGGQQARIQARKEAFNQRTVGTVRPTAKRVLLLNIEHGAEPEFEHQEGMFNEEGAQLGHRGFLLDTLTRNFFSPSTKGRVTKMSMTLQKANQLQKLIAETHPLLDISIKKIGQEHSDEWVCFVDATQYYLWDISDWLEYRDANMKRLEIFTEEGKAQAQAKWRQSRKANKDRQAELIA